jgi:hypothetical protein
MGNLKRAAISASESYKAKNDDCKPALRHPAFLADPASANRTLNRRMGLQPRGKPRHFFFE